MYWHSRAQPGCVCNELRVFVWPCFYFPSHACTPLCLLQVWKWDARSSLPLSPAYRHPYLSIHTFCHSANTLCCVQVAFTDTTTLPARIRHVLRVERDRGVELGSTPIVRLSMSSPGDGDGFDVVRQSRSPSGERPHLHGALVVVFCILSWCPNSHWTCSYHGAVHVHGPLPPPCRHNCHHRHHRRRVL